MPNHEIKTTLSALNSTLSAKTKFPIAISSKIYKTPTTIASRKNTIKIRFRSDEINLTPFC